MGIAMTKWKCEKCGRVSEIDGDRLICAVCNGTIFKKCRPSVVRRWRLTKEGEWRKAAPLGKGGG